jgi:multicomponent Na+:H+ antiporter subunit E
VFGVPFVILATFASLTLTPTRCWRIRSLGAVRYAWYFAHQSILGGIDVALRAIRPSMPLDPELVEYRMRLEPEHARVLFADTVSLLPGTLSTGFEGDRLTMHVIDCGLPVEQSLRDVEDRVADLFGLDLTGREAEFCTCSPGAVAGGGAS